MRDAIQKIIPDKKDSKDDNDEHDLDISVSVKRIGGDEDGKNKSRKGNDPSSTSRNSNKTVQELEATVEQYKLAKEKAESTFRDLRSDIIGLKSQNELLIKEKQRL